VNVNKIDNDFIQDIKETRQDQKIVVVTEADYQQMLKAKRNAEYLAMLDRSFKELDEGKVVVKTMEELEAMASDEQTSFYQYRV
jgi:antitoxin YefM